MVVLLVEMVKTMVEQQEQGVGEGSTIIELKKEVALIKEIQCQEKDELDETRQRNLKGNLIISSLSF